MTDFAVYGPRGSIFSGPWPEYLRRKRTDNGEPLVRWIGVFTSHDSTPVRLREENPHAKIVALSDPGCVPCDTVQEGGKTRYLGVHEAVRNRIGRTNANPDYCVAQAIYDSLAAGGSNLYWRYPDGEIACPQPQDAVWDPIGRTIRDSRGRMQSVLEVWAQHAKRYVPGIYDAISADCHAGTWLSYGDPWNRMGLGDLEWRETWIAFCRAMQAAGVPLLENCYGPGGPRNSDGQCAGFKIERPFEQGGTRDDHGWWGYVACTRAYQVYRTGLPMMTPEQARNTVLQVSPKDKTPAQQWELLRASLALAVLYDIPYVSAHDLWRNGEFWDPWSTELQREIELWTRLEPVGPTVWKRWQRRPFTPRTYTTKELPDAAECLAMGDLVGYRDVRDPIGGQDHRVWINPNPHDVGTVPALSVKLV